MDSLATFATAYAKRLGWWVFPIEPHGKRPMTVHGFQDASNDPAQITAWWAKYPNSNLGLDCGRSNIAVIDLDGPEGFASWNQLVDELELPEMHPAISITGGGGWHMLFRQPATPIRNSTSKLGKNIDTRGVGGYIVLTPSVHPSGTRYEWRDGYTPRIELDVLPPEIAVRVLAPEAAPLSTAKTFDLPRDLAQTIRRQYAKVATGNKGIRNQQLNKSAFYLYGLVERGAVKEPEVTEVLYHAALTSGLTERETIATLQSARRGAARTYAQ